MRYIYTFFKQLLIILLLSITACSNNISSKTQTIYVAVDGDNVNDGSLEKPYATLHRAVQASRDLRENGSTNPIVIYLRNGRHHINKTLVLGLQDGRTTDLDKLPFETYGAGKTKLPPYLTIAAYPNEKVELSAGVPITNWTLLKETSTELPLKAKGNVWVADMPEGLERFYTLYDGKGRLNRARNSGFLPIKKGTKKQVYFPKGALKNWENIEDVEIQVRPSRAWIVNMLPLAKVDEKNQVAETGVSATYEIGKLPGWVHNPSGASIWVENILEALDEPGEWVVNTQTRKIYLWPLHPSENGAPKDILAPKMSELIRVEGDVQYNNSTDIPVQGITFKGLKFTHGDRRAWIDDESRLGWGMQHDWDMFDSPTAMLRFRGAENCEVIDCQFINAGGSGVRLDLHAQRNRIENCEFAHLGEAGILLAGYGAGTKDVNHHNDIVNNLIHHFSEITWHSPGIWAWQSGHNHIAHNYVHHSGYAAVMITNRIEPDRSLNGEGGRTVRQNEIPEEIKNNTVETYENWKVREKYNHSRHNLLEYNELTHAVQKLSDGNAVYISGAGTGNIVRYNYIHDNLEHSFPAAIRCDDDQHETLIFGNILYNNYGFSAGIASKGVNDIINNFIVAPVTSPKWGYVSFEWVRVKGAKVHHNIIVSHPDGGNAYGERPIARSKDGAPLIVETDMDSNLYYHSLNSNWMNAHFGKMRAVGKEKASVFGDPMFVNPEKGNFSFKEGSPAIKLGIEPLDVSKMGLLD